VNSRLFLCLTYRLFVCTAPAISAVQCSDGGGDRVFGEQDTITIIMNQNTSVSVNTRWNTSQTISNLNPNVGAGLGSVTTALWVSADRVIITVLNATGVNVFQNCSQLRFRFAAAANAKDLLSRSAPSVSESTAAITSGAFGLSTTEGT